MDFQAVPVQAALEIAHAPNRLRAAVALAICLALGLLGPAGADAYVYWTNQSTGTIGRATLTGTEVELPVSFTQ